MTDPVSVPLSRLRVMPPQGAPVLWTRGDGSLRIGLHLTRDTVIALDSTGWVRMAELGDRERDSLALDLSAPTTSRIDGATVAATMLAEAAGLDVSRGVCWSADRDDPFDKGRGAVVIRAATGSAIRRYSEITDATDPRAILAAVLVAVLGVTP